MVNQLFTVTWMKSFCSHLQFEKLRPWRPSGPANQHESCGRGRVAGSVAAETTATSQVMKASIHVHLHNIHARGRLPQRKQAQFEEKTIGPPQQIPANLAAPERRERGGTRDGRLSYCTKCFCVYLFMCVCPSTTTCIKYGASYSIRLTFDTSLMHPVLGYSRQASNIPFLQIVSPHIWLLMVSKKDLLYCFSHFIYLFLLCAYSKLWLNEDFHPFPLIIIGTSECEWLVIVFQFNTQCNVTQGIIWLSVFIFLAY